MFAPTTTQPVNCTWLCHNRLSTDVVFFSSSVAEFATKMLLFYHKKVPDFKPAALSTSTFSDVTNQTTTSDGATEEEYGWRMAYFIVNYIFIAMIIVANSVTIFLLMCYRSLRTVTNAFALSLAAADMLTAFSYAVYNVINYTPYANDLVPLGWPCATSLYFIIVSAGCSLFSLTCIAIDRYIAVLHPLSYRTAMSRRRANLMIAAVWIYLVVAAFSLYAVFDKEIVFTHDTPCSLLNNVPSWYFFAVLIPHMVILNAIGKGLYFRILYVAWKQEKRIKKEQVYFTQSINRKEAKAAKMMGKILTLFLISWAPYMILHIALYIIGPSAAEWLFVALELCKLISLSNSYMNPIIYFWKNPDFRGAFKTCVRCNSAKRRSRVSVSSVGVTAEPISMTSNSQR